MLPTPGLRTARVLLAGGLSVTAVRKALTDELDLSDHEALAAVETAVAVRATEARSQPATG